MHELRAAEWQNGLHADFPAHPWGRSPAFPHERSQGRLAVGHVDAFQNDEGLCLAHRHAVRKLGPPGRGSRIWVQRASREVRHDLARTCPLCAPAAGGTTWCMLRVPLPPGQGLAVSRRQWMRKSTLAYGLARAGWTILVMTAY